MPVEYLNKQRKIKIDRKKLMSYIENIIKELGCQKYEITLLLVSNKKIKKLNSKWRGKNLPTDCLSFPLKDEVNNILGDIVISVEMAQKQSIEYGTGDIYKEIVFLFTHSLLHLLGYEHKKKKDAKKMFKLQKNLLEKAFS